MADMESVIELISCHLHQSHKKIIEFSKTNYSYEEWINWEIFDALKKANYHCSPKPSYRSLCSKSVGRFHADIYAKSPVGNAEFIMEVALVGNATQDKWLKKIERDRFKLSSLTPTNDSLIKVQLVILVADYHDLLHHWGGWLGRLEFWEEHPPVSICDQSVSGEIVFCHWEVAT
ncbi:hypothetical protein [Zobellella aerophila]|uniref:Uncharacterized protein n=1 Tax=Zobellella aerophila TaxID=870480 RepID=A0ABP6V857_9GAMM